MNASTNIQLVECPRDAMQGWPKFITTPDKVRYINSLLKVGFHTIDFGSFVSPKAIPQLADTAAVIPQLQLNGTVSKLLAIVANERGALEAIQYDEISYLGFPFSLSPTFQMRNTNCTMQEGLQRIDAIHELCLKNGKELVIYLSMGFGNPYGDAYNEEVLLHWAAQMAGKGIGIISLADTVGVATPAQIQFALQTLQPAFPQITWGVHLHSQPAHWKEKMEAAYVSGCLRYDGALKGIGGCPMAKDELVGNLNSEQIIRFLQERGHLSFINKEALQAALQIANEIFRT